MSKALQLAVEKHEEHMRNNNVPSCFTQEEYALWLTDEELNQTQPIRRFVCRDCTAEYRLKMIKEQRCFQKDPLVKKVFEGFL